MQNWKSECHRTIRNGCIQKPKGILISLTTGWVIVFVSIPLAPLVLESSSHPKQQTDFAQSLSFSPNFCLQWRQRSSAQSPSNSGTSSGDSEAIAAHLPWGAFTISFSWEKNASKQMRVRIISALGLKVLKKLPCYTQAGVKLSCMRSHYDWPLVATTLPSCLLSSQSKLVQEQRTRSKPAHFCNSEFFTAHSSYQPHLPTRVPQVCKRPANKQCWKTHVWSVGLIEQVGKRFMQTVQESKMNSTQCKLYTHLCLPPECTSLLAPTPNVQFVIWRYLGGVQCDNIELVVQAKPQISRRRLQQWCQFPVASRTETSACVFTVLVTNWEDTAATTVSTSRQESLILK